MIVRAIESCPFRQRELSRARAVKFIPALLERERPLQRMLHFFNLLLFTACFGSYAYGLSSFSERIPQKEAGFTAISVAGAVFMTFHGVCLFFFPSSGGGSELAGLSLYGGALALFWWAVKVSRRQPLELAYADEDPDYLVISGPYQYIRHPFYSAYMMIWLAGVFASGQWMLLPTAGIMLLLYIREAGLEEGRFERSGMREVFLRYKARSGGFFPQRNAFGPLFGKKRAVPAESGTGKDRLAA